MKRLQKGNKSFSCLFVNQLSLSCQSQLSRSRLRRQIARCNAIINRDKAEYYSTIISDNSYDPKKLRYTLCHVLDKDQETTFPPHQSEKSLANKFASFFIKKNQKDP